jgi:CRP-like cAMP-binding protein
MENAAAALAENSNFARLTLEQAERLIARATKRVFTEGSVLMSEGRKGSSMIVLAEGTVRVERGETLIADLSPGQILGEMALLDPAPRSATVTATSDGSCWELERSALWAILSEGDEAAVNVLQGLTSTVCSRLRDVNRLVQEEVLAPKGNVFTRLWAKVGKLGRK